MNDYILTLFKEFKQAMGISEKENIIQHSKDFEKWLKMHKLLLEKYVKLLDEMGLRTEKGVIAELGKTMRNTTTELLQTKGYNVIAITPFSHTFEKSFVTAYTGKLITVRDKPLVAYSTKEQMQSNPNCYDLLDNSIGTFITQLPNEDEVEIDAMIKACALSQDIVLGSYGNLSDNNFSKKITHARVVKNIIERMSGKILEDKLIKENGIYVHIIKT